MRTCPASRSELGLGLGLDSNEGEASLTAEVVDDSRQEQAVGRATAYNPTDAVADCSA